MADWLITATTIYCDAIDDEVTLIVYKDGAVICTGHQKYIKPDKETAKTIRIKGKQSGKQIRCDGLECHRVTQYRDRLFAGETGIVRNSGSE